MKLVRFTFVISAITASAASYCCPARADPKLPAGCVVRTSGVVCPTENTGPSSDQPDPITVSIANALDQSEIRAAAINSRRIDRHLTEVRQIAEDQEEGLTGSAQDGRQIASLGGVDASSPFVLGQLAPSAEAGFKADLEALAPKRINVFASGFTGFGSHSGSPVDSGYNYVQPGMTTGVDYKLTERLLLGFSFGFNHAESNISGGSDQSTSAYLFSLYGLFRPTSRSFIQVDIGYGSLFK